MITYILSPWCFLALIIKQTSSYLTNQTTLTLFKLISFFDILFLLWFLHLLLNGLNLMANLIIKLVHIKCLSLVITWYLRLTWNCSLLLSQNRALIFAISTWISSSSWQSTLGWRSYFTRMWCRNSISYKLILLIKFFPQCIHWV